MIHKSADDMSFKELLSFETLLRWSRWDESCSFHRSLLTALQYAKERDDAALRLQLPWAFAQRWVLTALAAVAPYATHGEVDEVLRSLTWFGVGPEVRGPKRYHEIHVNALREAVCQTDKARSFIGGQLLGGGSSLVMRDSMDESRHTSPFIQELNVIAVDRAVASATVLLEALQQLFAQRDDWPTPSQHVLTGAALVMEAVSLVALWKIKKQCVFSDQVAGAKAWADEIAGDVYTDISRRIVPFGTETRCPELPDAWKPEDLRRFVGCWGDGTWMVPRGRFSAED